MLLHSRQDTVVYPGQLIHTDKKATGVTAPSRKGLCMYWLHTPRKRVVMDLGMKSIILRLLKGWEVEFLLKLQSPCRINGSRRLGKESIHPMFSECPRLCETQKRGTQQQSTVRACRVAFGWVPPAMHLNLICLNVLTSGQARWLGQSIATPFSLQHELSKDPHFIIGQETWPQKVSITVKDQDQRHDVGNYTFEATDRSSLVLVLTCQMSTLFSNHRKINHQTASARTRRKDIMKGIRGDGKGLE